MVEVVQKLHVGMVNFANDFKSLRYRGQIVLRIFFLIDILEQQCGFLFCRQVCPALERLNACLMMRIVESPSTRLPESTMMAEHSSFSAIGKKFFRSPTNLSRALGSAVPVHTPAVASKVIPSERFLEFPRRKSASVQFSNSLTNSTA